MSITIDHSADNQLNEHPDVEHPYPREVAIDLGRPGLRYGLSVREMIHWLASRLDGSDDDHIVNHRTAVILRAVAERYYPYIEDEATSVIEELQDQGCADDFSFEDVQPPIVDARLLGLVDGYAVCFSTFDQNYWEDEASTSRPALNRENYLDVDFPPAASTRFGIKGMRLHCLDLIHWIKTSLDWGEMVFQDEETWLDALALSQARRSMNFKFRRDVEMRARYGDDKVDHPEEAWHALSGERISDPDMILKELDGLI